MKEAGLVKRTGLRFGLLTFIVMLVIGMMAHASQLQARDYPTKAVQLICPWSPGGSTDITGRVIAARLAPKWGVSVVVVNKAGGQGIPGTIEALNASPDGYTILVESNATSSLLDAWRKNLPFDIRERTYLANATELSFLFFVPATSPWKTMDDIAGAIRKDPTKVKFGWLGGTGGLDVPAAKFMAALIGKGMDVAKVKSLNMVTYSGGSEIATALGGGHVDVGITSATSARSLSAAGKVRAIAIAGTQRSKFFPEIPTTAEQGWSTVSSVYWVGFSGPKGLPTNIVQTWMDGIREVLKDPTLEKELDKFGLAPGFKGGDDFKRFVLNEAKEIKSLPVGGAGN